MMLRKSKVLVLLAFALTSAAWAADEEDATVSSSIESQELTRGAFINEKVGIKPQLGVLVYRDPLGRGATRAMVGATIDVNLATMIHPSLNNYYVGPSFGLFFSHLGGAGSNLIGTNADSDINGRGANAILIPLDIKIGFNITDQFRLAIHGGGNALYRSVGNAMDIGMSSNTGDSVWGIYPNLGGDIEFGVGRDAAIILRPDWTLTPGAPFFTGTIGINIPLV